MKLIELSKNGKHAGKYFAQVDDEDYEYLNQWCWNIKFKGKCQYAERVQWENGVRKGIIKMHKQIIGDYNGLSLDHIDRNGLNNQRSNLRLCTHKQNCANKNPTGLASKYRGVSFSDGYFYKNKAGEKKYCENKKKWVVQIGAMGNGGKWIGAYLTEKEAAIAYNEHAIKLYGEFANLNVIE